MTDQEAIERCQKGQREAFRHLVESYQDVLYGAAWLMTRDAALADDMVQEAFLSAWQGIRGFQRGRPIKPWLVRILVNKVLSYRRRVPVPAVQLDKVLNERGADPVFVQDTDDQDQIGRALSALPEEYRQTVVLRYFSGLSLAEISAAEGCPEGTVKSRLNRALEHLRQALGGE